MAYYEDIALIPNNFLKCILCEEVIENKTSAIESHIEGRSHRELYMKRLMSKNSIVIQNSELFCCVCNQPVKIDQLTQHANTTSHTVILSRLDEIIKKDGRFMQIPDNSENIQCLICNSDINFNLASVEEHAQSEKHKRAKSMVLQPLNGIFSVEDHDEYLWCKICQKFFDNYVELIIQHVEDSEHSKAMSKLYRLIDGQHINIDGYLRSPRQDKANCNKCNIEVPCNVDNLQRHINGKKHGA